jgi:hypothetical protein
VTLERFYDLGEVHQRAAETVDLVDDHAVDIAGLDVGEQPPEGGSLHVPAGEPTVVVSLGQADPALGFLASDVRLRRLTLGVERVELLLEAFVAALARVDGAACLRRAAWLRDRGSPTHLLPSSPKKRKPFMCEPVIALATAESDL